VKGVNLGTECSRTISGAFPDGWGRIPDNPLVAASVAALFRGGRGARALADGWSSGREGRLTYRRVAEDDIQIVVSLDPDAVLTSEGSASLAGQWSYVERISPLTIDVLLAVLAQLCAPCTVNDSKHPSPPPVPITARAILGYKRLQRWGAEGAALRRRVDSEIVRLQALRFDIRPIAACGPGLGRRNTQGVSADGDRLFDIVESTIVRTARSGSAARFEPVWTVRAGRWARWWMNTGAGVRFGAVPRPVLEFDHRRNRGPAVLAKKIGLGAAALWGGMRSRGSLDRRIGDLLADIGELPRRDARGGRWGARMRDRFDAAMLILQETGVIGRVEWPAGYQPGHVAHGRGWVDTWLASMIVLDLRGSLGSRGIDAATPLRANRHASKAGREIAELRRGPVIRAMRLERDVSQRRLADELGISAAYLSQIENQRRLVSRTVLGRIAVWLRTNRGVDPGGQRPPTVIAMIESGAAERQTAWGIERQAAGSRFARIPATGAPAGKDDHT